ncbi:MAG: PCP reductase family protein [Candidatus Anammoxibacter sp.]
MTDNITWTEDALERLKKIPFFVRKMAKAKIEKEAIEKGMTEITVEFMAEVKKDQH